jgi:hypothetical protein
MLAGIAAVVACPVLAFPIVGVNFGAMLEPFGSDLPLVTELAASVWFAPLLSLVPFGLVGAAFVLPRGRITCFVASLLASIAIVIGLLVALYYPIFELAGRVR